MMQPHQIRRASIAQSHNAEPEIRQYLRQRTGLLSMLFFFLALLAPAPARLLARDAYQPSSNSETLKQGALWKHIRSPFQFVLPEDARIDSRPRGNLRIVEAVPIQSQNFYLMQTAFLVRRNSIKELSQIIASPCAVPELPEDQDFVQTISCQAEIAENALVRTFHLYRRGKFVYVFYLVTRKEQHELAEQILASVAENADFCNKTGFCT